MPKDSISLELRFPKLKNGEYSVESKRTPNYNCIAWAAGVDDRPWWPAPEIEIIPPYYWPIENMEESLQGFIQAFESIGYQVCDDGEYEPEFIKVAIYADEEGVPTHMARQLEAGKWTSKLGKLEDIIHELSMLEGDGVNEYGQVACLMKRPRA